MNMHADRRNPVSAFRSKRLTTFRQIGRRRDKLLGDVLRQGFEFTCMRLIFALEEKKGKGAEAMRECRGETGGKRPTVPTNGW